MTGAASHILIADDNPTNRKLLRAILEAGGYHVTEAPDGEEALKVLEGVKIDAIISDVLMPRMDGYRFCHEVRKHPKFSTLPFLFLTATYTSPGDEKLALEVGADRILKKPLSSSEVLQALEAVLRDPRFRKPRTVKFAKSDDVMKGYTDALVIKLEERNDELQRRTEELKKLSRAVEQTADHVVITNKEGVIEYVNPAFERATGYSKDFAIGKTPSIIKSGKHDRAFYESLWGTILSGKPFRAEFINKKKNGELYYEHQTISPLFDEKGYVSHFVSSGTDLSDTKRGEASLRESEAQFRLISENVADLIAVLDPEGKRLYNSPSYRDILGEPEALKGTDSFDEIHPEDRARIRRVFDETVKTGVGQRTEFRFLTKEGDIRHIESHGNPIRDKQGPVSKVVVVSRDVTEKKKLEQQILRNQRMESIGTLAGGIAHDLNNVLSPILMAVEILKKKHRDQETQKILLTLESSAQRGAGMVKQVLTFARGLEGERAPLQIAHLIREMEQIVRETFPKSIRLKVQIPKGLWTVNGDATQLHQVLLNLCVNARDAMPQGGTLTISAENFEVDQSYAGMQLQAKTGPHIIVNVADTGTGIPPAILTKIFEPFFTTKEVGKGTGLGLSTVNSIVANHQGFMNVYSEPGRGTQFRVYLPAQSSVDEETRGEKKPELPLGGGELILLVDDEASIRDICKATLVSFGYRVVTASDGAEALALFVQQKGEIKLIITDMMMPLMDGRATIRAIRRINPSMKVIATSGLSEEARAIEHSDLGVQAFMQKPYTAEKLLRTVSEILGV